MVSFLYTKSTAAFFFLPGGTSLRSPESLFFAMFAHEDGGPPRPLHIIICALLPAPSFFAPPPVLLTSLSSHFLVFLPGRDGPVTSPRANDPMQTSSPSSGWLGEGTTPGHCSVRGSDLFPRPEKISCRSVMRRRETTRESNFGLFFSPCWELCPLCAPRIFGRIFESSLGPPSEKLCCCHFLPRDKKPHTILLFTCGDSRQVK